MVSWRCSCTGDPVADSLRDLLPHLVSHQLADLGTANQLLLTAQRSLVSRVLKSCGAENSVAWVNTYVELEDRLERQLATAGVLKDGGRIEDLFLANPTAIDPGFQAEVDRRHRALWDTLEQQNRRDEELPTWSLTRQLHTCQHPGWVAFNVVDGKLAAAPKELEVDLSSSDLQAAYLKLLASLEDYCYIHLSLPSAPAMRRVIGPAGAYILARTGEPATGFPSCLKAHLRSFLQAIVTTYVWSVGEHLRKSVLVAAEAFTLSRLTFERFRFAAERLSDLVDPLAVDTRPFDEAQQSAHRMFDTDSDHNVRDWTGRFEQAKRRLQRLCEELRDIAQKGAAAEGAASLVTSVATEIDKHVQTGTEAAIELALRHAKALDHDSICLSLLIPQAPAKTLLPTGNRKGHELRLREAVVQLHAAYRSQLSWREVIGASGSRLHYLDIGFGFPTDTIVGTALKLADGEDVGSLSKASRKLAPVLRGLFNPSVKRREDWVRALNTIESTVSIRITAEEEP